MSPAMQSRITGRGTLGAPPRAVIELDADGTVRSWNTAAETLLGWRAEEVLGRRLDVEPGCDGLGSLPSEVAKEVDRRLAQASKLEAVGRLAGGIAHDFNNLLLVIRSHASLLRERLGEEVVPELDEIERAGDDAACIVRQLLTFGRKQFLEPEVLDVNVALDRAEAMLRPLMNEDVELVRAAPVEAATALADPTQLELIAVNLVLNACDALSSGGRITIASEVVERAGAPWVALSVADTGTGIDEATRARIFEPFFTTKEEGRGTGLGLFVVQELVAHAGGEIEVSSSLGRGTTFTIYLPYVDEGVDEAPEIGEALRARLARARGRR